MCRMIRSVEYRLLSRRRFLFAGAAVAMPTWSKGYSSMNPRLPAASDHHLIVRKLEAAGGAVLPPGVLRLDYESGTLADWALLWPPDSRSEGKWFVVIHGHGSTGDQLYTRPDIRDLWLTAFRRTGAGILTPNLRGNAWMCPEAISDLHGLLALVRERYGARRFYLASGSMGGTSNLIYAAAHPEDTAGVVALCPATDLASYYAWCRHRNTGVLREIADAIEAAYRGNADRAGVGYAASSALRHARRLTMPVFMAHGTNDDTIPVSQSRRLVGAMADSSNLVYQEIAGGDHDSPLKLMPQAIAWILRT